MVKGMDKVRRQLAALPVHVAEAVKAQIEREAVKVVRDMKALAPRRTGALRDSIGWTWGDAPAGAVRIGTVRNSPTARIGVTIYAGGTDATARQQNRASGTRRGDRSRAGTFTADIARYQEFGTSRMPANPFFYPAWRSNRDRVRANLNAAIRRAVKKANARR